MILGITPDDRGLVPSADAQRMKEFGDKIAKRFSDPIAKVTGKGETVVLKLTEEQMVNQVVIMEDIAFGERIRDFQLKGLVGGKWELLYEGTSIGHKHTAVFDEKEISAVKLVVQEAIGEPVIEDN